MRRRKPGVGMLWASAAAFMVVSGAADAQQQTPERARLCETGRVQLAKPEIGEGATLPVAINKRLSKKRGNAVRGLDIAADPAVGDCLACHRISKVLGKVDEAKADSARKHGKHGTLGPSLDGVGGRFSEGELRLIVVDPARAFPEADTTMPAYHSVKDLNDVHPDCKGRPILSAQQVEDVVAFLRTLK